MAYANEERTEAACLNALRRAATELGASPTKAQYEELGLTPAASTILRVCGGWNAAKKRAGLETNASTGSRVADKPEDIELPSGTDWADLSANQRWYYTHRDADTTEKRQRRTELRAWLYEVKQDASCHQCGDGDTASLEFHHRPGAEKLMDVGQMVAYGYGRDAIRDEIEKCAVLCANCHRREHHGEYDMDDAVATRIRADVRAGRAAPNASPYTKARYLRRWTTVYKRTAGCSRCGTTDARCLEFHHLNPETKVAGVGEMISNSYPASDVIEEVGKCHVLCANCHRTEHYERPAYEPST